MSDFQPLPAPEPTPAGHKPSPEPKNRRSWLRPAGLALAAAVIGYGAAGGTPAAPEPEVITETKVVTETKEVEVPVEVPVEVTPAACIDALDLAAEGFLVAASYVPLIEQAARAGVNQDAAAINAVIGAMKASNADLQDLQPLVTDASAKCRASAEPGA